MFQTLWKNRTYYGISERSEDIFSSPIVALVLSASGEKIYLFALQSEDTVITLKHYLNDKSIQYGSIQFRK